MLTLTKKTISKNLNLKLVIANCVRIPISKKTISKNLNLKLVIAEEYQSTKVVFAKFYVPNLSKHMFVIKKIKKHCVVDTRC